MTTRHLTLAMAINEADILRKKTRHTTIEEWYLFRVE